MALSFTSELELAGKTATGFKVPAEIVEQLGAGKRPKVVVTVNGYTWRSSIAPYGGAFYLGVSAVNRAGAGIEAHQVWEVAVEADTAPRVVEPPADLAAELQADAAAAAAWNRLSYTHQREHATAIESAKTAKTRRRRIDRALDMLRTG